MTLSLVLKLVTNRSAGASRCPALCAAVCLFLLIGSATAPADGQPIDPAKGEYEAFSAEGDIRRFDGENLYYDISFLWFEKAATAQVHFYKKNGEYQALLIAETKGFVGWFTSYRRHIYKADFEIIDNGSKVRARRFEREVIIGDYVEQTVNTMDYATHKNHWYDYKGGALVEQNVRDIPADVQFDDILSAFYNFRNSAYGKVHKDANFTINTIPEKGVDKITVQVKGNDEQEVVRVQQTRAKNEELLLKVIVPKEIFKTKTGSLLFWSSRHLIPLETTVMGYILLGDLRAEFVRRTNNRTEVPSLPKLGHHCKAPHERC